MNAYTHLKDFQVRIHASHGIVPPFVSGVSPFSHGLCGSAIVSTELEVVQHRVILLGKPLVCVLNHADVSAHLVSVP